MAAVHVLWNWFWGLYGWLNYIYGQASIYISIFQNLVLESWIPNEFKTLSLALYPGIYSLSEGYLYDIYLLLVSLHILGSVVCISKKRYLLINPITHGGGAIKTQVGFNAQFDPEGVKFDRWYFMTFPKCTQIPL